MQRLVASRSARVGLLVAMAGGWLGIIVGVLGDLPALVAAAAVVTGASNVALVKLHLETRSAVVQLALSTRIDRGRSADQLRSSENRRTVLEERSGAFEERIVQLEERGGELEVARARIDEHIARLELEASARDSVTSAAVESRERADRQAMARLGADLAVVRDALAMTRQVVDKLAVRVSPADVARLTAVAERTIAEPLLTVAIPSFNRPAALAECLASVEREVVGRYDDIVEVCVVDDASTDPDTLEVALAFAERNPFASVHRQPVNLGIERNVLDTARRSRGTYTWLFGNDDAMVEGAMATVIGDLRAVGAAFHLYEKSRITVDGEPRDAVPGSSPIDAPAGATCEFPGLIEAASRQGFFSTFGYITQYVFRTDAFNAADASPFFDLTMYPQVFMLVQAFGHDRVVYRNTPVALHRTSSQPQKLVEALGRREEEFMAGGTPKLSRYFGTTLAAAWQRAIDLGAITASSLAVVPERLMTDQSLVEWIRRNRKLDAGRDADLDRAVVADGERFLAAIDAIEVAG